MARTLARGLVHQQQGAEFANERLTVEQVLGRWLEAKQGTVASGTWTRYEELAATALVDHRDRQAVEREQQGVCWEDQGLVFTNGVGGPLDPHNLRSRSFSPLLDRAGLPRIRFHDLRHSCATLLLSEGIHPKIVSDLLGHSQISITLDPYSHVTATVQAIAAEAMGRLLGGQDDGRETDGGQGQAP